ncbi:MAG: MFS transporter [Verrucomicrobiales bacterium]|nr:MFS transporter [Verrucomicrobiales bacterium]
MSANGGQGGGGGTRHWVIFFAVTLAIITYIDRVCISKAAPAIQADMGFTKEQMGYVFSAFGLAYALFEIPGGWLGDKMGPRRVLSRIVAFWSFFTAATGWAWNWASMVVCRFLFGAGEAGAFPNITKMFTIWLPQRERGPALGITWLAARWGGAFTPLLVVWVFGFLTWREAFMAFGALGVVWAAGFFVWFRDDPRTHPRMSPAEIEALEGAASNLDGHAAIPWKKFLASPTVLLLWLYYFCISYVWYFYITWMPTYMKEHLHLDGTRSALLGGLPLFLGGIGCFAGGWLARRITPWVGGLARARRLVSLAGMFGAGFFLVLATLLGNPVWAMVALGMSGFCNDLSMPGAWGACMDVGGKAAGSLSGSMNMMGNLGGALGPLMVPYLLAWTGNNWNVPLWVAAATYLVSAGCWMLIDPVTPIEATEDPGRRPGPA